MAPMYENQLRYARELVEAADALAELHRPSVAKVTPANVEQQAFERMRDARHALYQVCLEHL